MKLKGIAFFLLGLVLLVLSATQIWEQYSQKSISEKDAKLTLQETKEELEERLEGLKFSFKQGDIALNQLRSLNSKRGITFYIFIKKSLVLWTDEETILPFDSLDFKSDFYQNSNAAHVQSAISVKDTVYLAFKKIYTVYDIQNEYLTNKSNFDLFQAYNTLKDSQVEGEFDNNWNNKSINIFALITFLLSYCFILIWIARAFLNNLKSAIFLTINTFYFLLPVIISDVFSQDTYFVQKIAISILELKVNVFQLFFISLFVFTTSYGISRLSIINGNRIIGRLSSILSILIIVIAVKLLIKISIGSDINLELDNLFNLNLESYLVIVSIFILFLSAFIWANRFVSNEFSEEKNHRNVGRNLIAILFLLSFLLLFFKQFVPLLFFSLFIGISFFSIKLKRRNQAALLLSLVIITVLVSTYIIREQQTLKELSQRKDQLKVLSEVQDDKAEYLFVDLQNAIRGDQLLIQKLKEKSFRKNTYKDYLRELYFNGYWDSYSITITLCDAKDSILTSEGFANRSCIDFFNERLLREGDNVSANNFFRLSNLAGRIDYIAEIPLLNNDIIYVELSRNNLIESLGYPNLLINKKEKDEVDLKDYSYAIYFENELINRNGKYIYSNSHDLDLKSNEFIEFDKNGYSHIAYRKDEATVLFLSKEETNLLQKISFFTYLFIICGLTTLLIVALFRGFPLKQSFSLKDFASKVQLLLISSLLFSLVLFGMGSTYFIQQQYELKNSENIEEKLKSINMELEQKIGVEESLPPVLQAYVQSLLIKFSNIFFTDINLYNLEGTLFATSRPELYLQKIKARRMHSLAYQKLKEGELSEWIQKENIGEFKYLSAYIPFKNQNNQTIAYLNIPYYAKEKALEEEIAAFLIPTINICLIVFTIALIFLLVINKQITKPLSLIRDYFKKLRLGNKVELIEWKSKDEIGELVTEYNKIAIELSESANELAKNERELAWREMAKQVAHEIKNPLTPMKLSVQHLQMAAKAKVEDLDDRIKRTSETLVSQIDALSNIASAFSSFASLPAQKQNEINLIPPIQDAFQLYTNQAKILFEIQIAAEEAIVLGDRDQLLSVFNNLLKNAIQAKDERKEDLLIKIILKEESDTYIIEISDNGKGIDDMERERIFEPSFTTKSSGSGLGLSIAKRIIENMLGEISFHSKENVGTTFTIRLPKAKD